MRVAFVALSCCVLGACAEGPVPVVADPPSAASAPAALPATAAGSAAAGGTSAGGDRGATAGIAWFDGSVEAAFAAAASERKPVLLYWTATWCPPCHELKAHVFSRPEVIAHSRSFVAVYLDGDTEGAQKLGERYHVLGYPTAVVLRPDGTEITRVGGGMDLEAYAEAIDVALAERRPVGAILAGLGRNEGAALSADDCRRLAWHGWGVEVAAEPGPRSHALQRAATLCPAGASLERARLELLAGQDAARAEAAALESGALPSPRLAALLARLHPLLRDAALAPRLADLLRFPEPAYLAALRTGFAADVAALREDWIAVLMRSARDPAVSPGVQLNSVGAALAVHKGLAPGPLPPELADVARQLARDALERHASGFAHTGVVNGASIVYAELDDRAAARRLLEHEVATATNPHYYLTDLADLEEAEGHAARALELHERAYRLVQGPASRFQWGTLYVEALLRLAPRDAARIERVALAVLGELDGPDRLYTRSRLRLARLDARLRDWAAAHPGSPLPARLRARLAPVCQRYAAGDPARASCDGFLAGLGAGPAGATPTA